MISFFYLEDALVSGERKTDLHPGVDWHHDKTPMHLILTLEFVEKRKHCLRKTTELPPLLPGLTAFALN